MSEERATVEDVSTMSIILEKLGQRLMMQLRSGKMSKADIITAEIMCRSMSEQFREIHEDMK